jgi:CAAX prenyl protease-like protein
LKQAQDTDAMDTPDTNSPIDASKTPTVAHGAPLAVFMGFLFVLDGMRSMGLTNSAETAAWWQRQPELWLYPLQTAATLAVLWFYRKSYTFRPLNGLWLAVLLGVLGIAVWIAPGFLATQFRMNPGVLSFLGFKSRTNGFDPTLLTVSGGTLYWLVVLARFVRLVIAVPLAEEIFWRGFLMRYLVNPDGDFWQVRFGTFHWKSLTIVTALFVAAHSAADYAGAAIFGVLMYFLAVRTKSLAACVLMHAVANLLLGLYVLKTQQWGYW